MEWFASMVRMLRAFARTSSVPDAAGRSLAARYPRDGKTEAIGIASGKPRFAVPPARRPRQPATSIGSEPRP